MKDTDLRNIDLVEKRPRERGQMSRVAGFEEPLRSLDRSSSHGAPEPRIGGTLSGDTARKKAGTTHTPRSRAGSLCAGREEEKWPDRMALLEVVANNSAESIVVADLDGAVGYISPACRQLTGYSPKELMGMLSLELVHPKERSRLAGHLRNLAAGESCTVAYRILRKDGKYVWIESAVDLLRDPVTAEPVEVVVVSHDITARKLAEEKTDLMDFAPNPMIMVGADGRIVSANPQTGKLFGYARHELLGQPLEILVPERFRANHIAHRSAFCSAPVARALGAGPELFGLRRDGSEVPVEISLDPVCTAKGRFVLASFVDLTERKEAEDHLHLFRILVEGARDYAIFMLDPDGHIQSWNEGAARMKGYSASEIVGQHFSRFYTPEDVSAGHPEHELRDAQAHGKFEEEGWRIRRDGSRFWASVLITAVLDKHGNLRGFAKLTRDITERKRSDEILLERERTLRLLMDAMPQLVWSARPDGYLEYFNQQWYEVTGAPKGLGGEESWRSVIYPDDLQRVTDAWYSAMKSGDPYEMQCRFWDRRSRNYRWFLGRGLPLRNELGVIEKWIGTATEIDDYKRLREELEVRVDERTAELKEMLGEKTTLLKEVHHRVKNNLQVICSLLSMQIECSNSDSSLPLKDAHSRVLAMSLIHEQIYQSETVAEVDFGGYIGRLANRLFSAYCVDPSRIRMELSVEDIQIPMHQAIPCALILNELLSNALKHAFEDGRDGAIRIALRKTETGCAEITVADNGVGLPAKSGDGAKGFGRQVVETLIRQLRAELSVNGENGAVFRFSWKLPK